MLRVRGDTFGGLNETDGLERMIDEHPEWEIVLEIGTFSGVSASCFAERCESVLTVDLRTQPGLEERVAQYENLGFWQMSSEAASHQFLDHTFDVVYIDAEHDYESCAKDIRLWLPKIKIGGNLAGHDFWMEGVRQAVAELDEPFKVYADSSWVIDLPVEV